MSTTNKNTSLYTLLQISASFALFVSNYIDIGLFCSNIILRASNNRGGMRADRACGPLRTIGKKRWDPVNSLLYYNNSLNWYSERYGKMDLRIHICSDQRVYISDVRSFVWYKFFLVLIHPLLLSATPWWGPQTGGCNDISIRWANAPRQTEIAGTAPIWR